MIFWTLYFISIPTLYILLRWLTVKVDKDTWDNATKWLIITTLLVPIVGWVIITGYLVFWCKEELGDRGYWGKESKW